jgi:hypothetical protein
MERIVQLLFFFGQLGVIVKQPGPVGRMAE